MSFSVAHHEDHLERCKSHVSVILESFQTDHCLFTAQIAPVPTSQEFLDIVLSRTQRQLPTQIRAGFKISRIRGIWRPPECDRLSTEWKLMPPAGRWKFAANTEISFLPVRLLYS